MVWITLLCAFVFFTKEISSQVLSAGTLPSGCTCISDCSKGYVNCSSSKFNSIPSFSPEVSKSIKYLILKNNTINNFDTTLKFDSVVRLDVSYSKIERVSEFVGYAFPKVELLELSGNRIKEMSWLIPFSKITELRLHGNLIESLLPNTRSFVHTNIQDIDLSSNNIADANPLSKWQMRSLKRLNLSGNKINDLRDVTFPPNLLQLDISHNRLTVLMPEFTRTIPKVQWLRLAHNELTSMLFLISNQTRALWKVDLVGNRLVCTCELYLQKVALGHKGLVFGDEPHCTDSTDMQQSLFSFGDTDCPQKLSNICQDNSFFHYSLQRTKITWDTHVRLQGVNVSWIVSDVSGAEMQSGNAPIAAAQGHLIETVGDKVAQLCVQLSRGSLTCLHSCRLLPSSLTMSRTSQILVVVIAIFAGIVVISLICFLVCSRCHMCKKDEPTLPPSSSLHSLHHSVHGSRTDLIMETNLDERNLLMRRPMSAISNGNQTVPGHSRYFVRNQAPSGGSVLMQARGLSRSEHYLSAVPNASMHVSRGLSMSHLNASRQSLASRALPEVPNGSYCEMANVPVQDTYEVMDDGGAFGPRAPSGSMAGNPYQEPKYD